MSAVPSPKHVFMSYCRHDQVVMERVLRFLRKQGIKVWVDSEVLVPGTPTWRKGIEKAIISSNAVIVLLSPDANNSIWVERELNFAETHEKRIFPLLIAGDEKSSIPIGLTSHQKVDIRQDEEIGMRSLCSALMKYLEDLERRESKAQEKEERERKEAYKKKEIEEPVTRETVNALFETESKKQNRSLNRKIRNLNTVIEIGKLLTASVNLSEAEVLGLIHEQLNPIMDTENMYIALFDRSTNTVRFPLMFVDGEKIEVSDRKAGSGRTEHIIASKEPLFIETREESIAWYKQFGRKEYIQEPFASWIGVPMISGDQVIGVIATYHKTDDYVYDQDDLELLQAIANQASIALEVTQRTTELKKIVGSKRQF